MSGKRAPITIDAEVIERDPAPLRKPKIDLRDLQAVRREMAGVYRDMRAGKIETQDGTRLAYVLGELVKLHAVIELEGRLNQLENTK